MTAHPTTTDETTRPVTVGDRDDQDDTRQLAPDADDRDVEEAGYGYGV